MLLSAFGNFDIWLYFKAAKDLLTEKSFIYFDKYSFTTEGQRWIFHSWLSAVIFYCIYYFFSFKGLVILRFVCGYFLFILIIKYLYKNIKYLNLIVLFLLIILYFNFHFWAVRAYIFSYVLGFIFFIILEKEETNFKEKAFLIVLMVLWANLHAGFVLGLEIYFCYLLSCIIKRTICRQDIILFILLIIAGLLNPNGYLLYLYPFKLLHFKELIQIQEWTPLFCYGNLISFLNIVIIIVFFVNFILLFKKKYFHFFLFLIVFILTLKAVRNLPLFAILGITSITVLLRNKKITDIQKIIVNILLLGLLIFYFFDMNPSKGYGKVFWKYSFNLDINKDIFPFGVVEHIKKNKAPNNIFNDQKWG